MKKQDELMANPDYKPWLDPCLPYSYLWWSKVPIAEGIARWREIFGVTETTRIGGGVAASVVIPVYNAAEYLPQMLISLAAQTLANIEIICVDDGSTDGSLAVCKAFAEHDWRIKVVSQSNQGAAAARNNGLEMAVGKWVIFVDADDFCRPEMLAEMVAEGEKGAEVVVTSRHYLDFRGRHKGLNLPIPKKYFELGETLSSDTEGFDVFSGLGFPPWNKLYRREFLLDKGLEFYNLPVCNDLTFVACSLLRAERIRLLPQAYYFYRSGNPTSVVGRSDRHPTAFLNALDAVWREVASRSLRLQTLFYAAAIHFCFWNLMRKQSAEGMHAVYQALLDGGLAALKGAGVDDAALSLGAVRDAYDALMRREPLEMVLLALSASYKLEMEVRRHDLREIKQKLALLNGKVGALKEKNIALKNGKNALGAKVAALKAEKASLKQKLAEIKASRSYRLGRLATAPFRMIRRLSGIGHRCAATCHCKRGEQNQ